MISVTDDFKSAISAMGKQLRAYVTDGVDQINDTDDLRRIYIHQMGGLLKTTMRKLEFTYTGSHSYLGSTVNPFVGVVLPSDTIEYIDYGEFKVVSIEEDKVTDGIKAIAYDKMYEALIKFDLTPSYPLTLLVFLQAICTRLSWTLKTGTTFPNETLTIDSDLFLEQNVTFRYVLDRIAEASASMILFNTDNELEVRQVGTSLETLNSEKLMSLKVEDVFGAVDKVILAREPQADYIYQELSA